MKSLLFIFLWFCFVQASATDYHFSNSGNDDTGDGTIMHPFRSLIKAQSLATANNRILFKRGDTWVGNLLIQYSGEKDRPVYFGAYGIGEKPVITGFTKITDWEAPVKNIYTSKKSVSTLATCNILSNNGNNYAKARFPDKGYLTISNTNNESSITDPHIGASLISAGSGAQVVIRELMYEVNCREIKNISGNTLLFAAGAPAKGWGFFLQNDINLCSIENEWIYNTSSKKISLYANSIPADILVPAVEYGINTNGKQYLSFDSLDIQGFNTAGIFIGTYSRPLGITITHCSFSFIGINGIDAYGDENINPHGNAPGLLIAYNHFTEMGSRAIFAASGSNAIITGNRINNVGIYPGMGSNGDNSYTAIVCDGDETSCRYNSISNVGYNGIHCDGNSTDISFNYINRYNFVKDDGGGIYCYPVQTGNAPNNYKTRTISHNIIMNAIGAPDGSGISGYKYQSAGIYLDGQSSNIDVFANSIGNENSLQPTGNYGIFVNGGKEICIQNNTVYNWRAALYITTEPKAGGYLSRLSLTDNIFCSPEKNTDCDVQNKAAQFNFGTTYFPKYSIAKNNVYANPLSKQHTFIAGKFPFLKCYSLQEWQNISGQEKGSSISPFTTNDISNIEFIYNQTPADKLFILPASMTDLSNNNFSAGELLLKPFESKILIRN